VVFPIRPLSDDLLRCTFHTGDRSYERMFRCPFLFASFR